MVHFGVAEDTTAGGGNEVERNWRLKRSTHDEGNDDDDETPREKKKELKEIKRIWEKMKSLIDGVRKKDDDKMIKWIRMRRIIRRVYMQRRGEGK